MALSVLQIAYYPSLLQTRRVILESDGYSVVSALGNDQGMAIAASETFDVIVVGFSAAHATRTSMVRWLKQHAPIIPVVALLAHDLEEFPDADYATLSEDPIVWLAMIRQACAKNSN
jgi:DNA-binding NtrC family response regulator